jgi:hypothetical protein
VVSGEDIGACARDALIMVTAQAPNRLVSGVDEPTPPSRTQGSVKYTVEAIGTFFLVFTVGAAAGSVNPLAPLSIGAVPSRCSRGRRCGCTCWRRHSAASRPV